MSFFRWLFPNGIGIRGMLASLLSLALVGATGYVLWAIVAGGTTQNKVLEQVALMLVGAFISNVGIAVGHFFGGRQGAAEAVKGRAPGAPSIGGPV